MISRLLPTSSWRPSPSFERFMREAHQRSARARRDELLGKLRAFLARHALLIVVGAQLVGYAACFVALDASRSRTARAAVVVDQMARNVELYHALVMGLVRAPQEGRVQVRLTAAGREEMLVLLEQMHAVLKDQRGEVRP